MGAIERLSLSRNSLDRIPEWLFAMRGLKSLNLSFNRIEDAELADDADERDLAAAEQFAARSETCAEMTGQRALRSSCWRGCPALTFLDISNNRIKELPLGILGLKLAELLAERALRIGRQVLISKQ